MKLTIFQGVVLGIFALGAIVGLLVFSLYSGSGSKSVGAVVIWGTFPQQDIQAALTAIIQTEPTLKDVSYVQKDPATFDATLVSAIAAGAGPDLVLASQEDLITLASALQPIPSGKLSARTFASDFTAGSQIWEAPSTIGSYGIPFLIDPLILYANQPLLASNGIAQTPSTWEALTGLVPQVTLKGNNSTLSRELIALGTYSNISDARAILSTLFLQSGAPITVLSSVGQVAPDLGLQSASGGEPPGDSVVRFYTQFADSTKVSYTWNNSLPTSQLEFANGDLALYLGYASEASYFKEANPNLSFDTSPVPELQSATSKFTYGKIYAFSIPHGAKNPNGALTAALALASSGSAESAAASATGLAPALRALLATTPGDSIGATTYTSALYAGGWLSPSPSATDQIFSSMIGSVNSGQLSIAAALANAQSALSAILQ